MTQTISYQRIHDIAAILTEAGSDWQEAAERIPEIVEVIPGDELLRDHCTVSGEVVDGARRYPSLLYRDEYADKWRPMGWSAAAWAEVNRPRPFRWDPDAGVHVPADMDGEDL